MKSGTLVGLHFFLSFHNHSVNNRGSDVSSLPWAHAFHLNQEGHFENSRDTLDHLTQVRVINLWGIDTRAGDYSKHSCGSTLIIPTKVRVQTKHLQRIAIIFYLPFQTSASIASFLTSASDSYSTHRRNLQWFSITKTGAWNLSTLSSLEPVPNSGFPGTTLASSHGVRPGLQRMNWGSRPAEGCYENSQRWITEALPEG